VLEHLAGQSGLGDSAMTLILPGMLPLLTCPDCGGHSASKKEGKRMWICDTCGWNFGEILFLGEEAA
jgi:ribosomal protein L37AE/L43A